MANDDDKSEENTGDNGENDSNPSSSGSGSDFNTNLSEAIENVYTDTDYLSSLGANWEHIPGTDTRIPTDPSVNHKLSKDYNFGQTTLMSEEATRLNSDITSLESTLSSVSDRLVNIEKNIDGKSQELEDERKRTAQLRSELEDLTGTASNLIKNEAGESIGRHFEERREELERGRDLWMYATFGSVAVLVVAAVLVYLDISTTSAGLSAGLAKVALLLPVSIAVWFCISNYNRRQNLIEEYEFKANMALSLMGFREVLVEEIPAEERDKVGEFMIDSLSKIYTNPLESRSNGNQQDIGYGGTANSILSILQRNSGK